VVNKGNAKKRGVVLMSSREARLCNQNIGLCTVGCIEYYHVWTAFKDICQCRNDYSVYIKLGEILFMLFASVVVMQSIVVDSSGGGNARVGVAIVDDLKVGPFECI
jgi:hypothetical protein